MPDSNSMILVVGSLNMDQIVRVPHVPTLGETLLGSGSLKLVPGGKGANQAVALSHLGASVAMAGRVGNDTFGQQLVNSLLMNKVDTGLIAVDPVEATGVAFIFLTPDGDNIIVVASGSNMRVGLDEVQSAETSEAIAQARALVLQMEIPAETVGTLIRTAHKAGVPVVLNLAPAEPLIRETLEQVEVLIVNETEAGIITGQRISSQDDARVVATVLHNYGIPIVVITLGSQGAILASNDGTGNTRIIYQSAPQVQVVDTTAAGDCFVAAFTVAWTEGQKLEDALEFAVYAGALKVTRFGAQSGLPTRAEVEAFLQSAKSR